MQNETSLCHKTMTLCLEQGTVRSLITTKQNKPTFVSFLVFVRCRERTRRFDSRP